MFKTLGDKVRKNYETMVSKNTPIFLVDFNKDIIWEKYLEGFKDTAVKQSYNCNCCKSFFRRYGGIVILDENLNYITVFDNTSSEIMLDDEMREDGMLQAIKNVNDYIKSLPLKTLALFQYDPKEAIGGVYSNIASLHSQYSGQIFYHYSVGLKSEQVIQTVGTESSDSKRGEFQTKASTLVRCIEEIKQSDTELLLELINQGSIYRGEEFKGMLNEFLKIQKEYSKQKENQNRFLFLKAVTTSQSITNIRNTAIGTLLTDIAEGVELNTAVSKYEKVVAPSNYKRPIALATPKMIEAAKTTIKELGYLESLERRFATETDLDVNNVLFTYRGTEDITDSIFDEMKTDTLTNPNKLNKVEEITVDKFLSNVLPTAKKVEILLENRHTNNLVSLLTEKLPSKRMFKWDNPFSWSYSGGITDAIKEKVKLAGGNVDGDLRVSLAWANGDDLDLHIYEANGNHIYFGNKRSSTSGFLDVDMNAGEINNSKDPVENIIYTDKSKMGFGKYKVYVDNYNKRSKNNIGYTVQIEADGQVFEFHEMTNNSKTIVEIEYTKEGFKINGNNISSVKSNKVWNLDTYKFHTVSNVMMSPNFWGVAKGNKHYIFTLKNCITDEQPRPFFNEFLNEDLEKHRKVFEMLGSKVKIEDNNNQLSGVGFSETMRNEMIVRVTSKFERLLKIKL